jgi:hypothetical protein
MLNINPLKLDLVLGAVIVLLVAIIIYNHRRIVIHESNKEEGLGVKDLIENVKKELVETEKNRLAANEPALFEIKDFDLEINFVVSTRRTLTGQLEYKVVTVGDETQVSSERVQKITLHMTAIPPNIQKEKASESPLNTEGAPVTSEQPPEEKKKP